MAFQDAMRNDLSTSALKPRSHQALRHRRTTCDGYILGYRESSCDVERCLRDREASSDVLVGLFMSKNLAMITGVLGSDVLG